MGDMKLFRIVRDRVEELPGKGMALEKSLQNLIEQNLESLFGIRFLASEYPTGPKHGGRIDTLGIDENGNPVIIEYKRAVNENVINQGLFYLDWLLDHKADFVLLVQEKLGKNVSQEIDWSAPRLVCIAGDFTRYDEHAVQQIGRNIELVRYRKFGEDLLLFELVGAVTAEESTIAQASPGSATMSEQLENLRGPLRDLYEELRAYLLALGDDVREEMKKNYVAFKRLRNFACVEIRPAKGALIVFLKVNPDEVELVPGFTRDVRNIGHWGTGNLEVTLRSREDFERAKPLIEKSYEKS